MYTIHEEENSSFSIKKQKPKQVFMWQVHYMYDLIGLYFSWIMILWLLDYNYSKEPYCNLGIQKCSEVSGEMATLEDIYQ